MPFKKNYTPWNKGNKTSKLNAETFRLQKETSKKITHLKKKLKLSSRAKVVDVSIGEKYEAVNR